MKSERGKLIDSLLHSDEPSIRWKTVVAILGDVPKSRKVIDLQGESRKSPRVKALLASRDERFVRER